MKLCIFFFVLVIPVKLVLTFSTILSIILFVLVPSSVVKLICAKLFDPLSAHQLFIGRQILIKSTGEPEHTADTTHVIIFSTGCIVCRKYLEYDNARGEAHGKEGRMDEVFIDDSQGHGDDQLVDEYACRIISPTRN